MSASGILRSDNVIFYHPFDNLTEYTQNQSWSGDAGFTAGKIDDAIYAAASDSFSFGAEQSGESIRPKTLCLGLDESNVLFIGDLDQTVGTVSGDSIVYSPEDGVAIGSQEIFGTVMDWDGSDGHAVIFMHYYGRTHLLTITDGGDTITGSSVWYPDGSNPTTFGDVATIDSTHFLMATSVLGGTRAVVATRTGGSFAYGSANAFPSTVEIAAVETFDSSKGIFLYNQGSNTGGAMVCSISGDTVTFGSGVQISNSNEFVISTTYKEWASLTPIDSSTALALWQYNSIGYGSVLSISGETITSGAITTFEPDTGSRLQELRADYMGDNKVCLSYLHQPGAVNKQFVRVATVSGTTVSFGDKVEVGGNIAGMVSPSIASLNSTSCIAGFESASDIQSAKIGGLDQLANIESISGTYPTMSGATRITNAMWVKNPTIESTQVDIDRGLGFGYSGSGDLQITMPYSGSVHWTASGVGSTLNDGESHLIIVDAEHEASGVWRLSLSLDGGNWSDYGTGSGTQPIPTTDTAPKFELSNGESNQWVDELVLWGGDKTTFTKFTDRELFNLNSLANYYGQPMYEYSNTDFILGTSSISGNLYTQASAYKLVEIDLFVKTIEFKSDVLNLFVEGYGPKPASGSISLVMNAHSSFGSDSDLYWVEAGIGKIRSSGLDGGDASDLITTGLNQPMGICLDLIGQRMYYSDYGTDTIKRANLDGSAEETIVTGLSVPREVVVDPDGGKVYWADGGANNIQRSDLDGSNKEVLVSSVEGFGIDIDTTNDKLYFTSADAAGSILKSDMDGSNVEYIISGSLSYPRPLVLDNDSQHIYWANYYIGNLVEIVRADFDGGNQTIIFPSGMGYANIYGLAIDTINGHLYVSDYLRDDITRIDLDGSNQTIIVTNLSDPRGIAVNIGSPPYVDLFIEGIDSIQVSSSGDLFIDSYDIDNDNIDLYMNGESILPFSGSMPLFTVSSGPPTSGADVRQIDTLLRTPDYSPQLLGSLTNATSVTIQIWEITGGQNTPLTLSSSDCYQIGDTGRWAWSTSNLPLTETRQLQYLYLMTADTSDTFSGQFFMDYPESTKWIYPNNQTDYIKRI